MNTLEIRVKEIISVVDEFGKQIKKTFERIAKVFGFGTKFIFKQIEALFGDPGMRARPPTVYNLALLIKPPKMAYTVFGGFILLK